ncbi:hypothetical protein PHMEG_00037268, partial [Phytophthora megakarya]
MDMLPGESRGYWKHHSPGKWFRQAKIAGNIHNEKAILLLDTGAEVSIVDTAFARKVGCYIDSSQIQGCVGIGDNVYQTEGRTRIKVTLAGLLVYFFDIWVGDLTGQQAILGMDFMVPAGIRLYLAHESISLPDEVQIQFSGRQKLYSDKAKIVNVDQRIGIWLAGDHVPRIPDFISIGPRRYKKWQNLALEATTDTQSEEMEIENPPIPAVERPEYETPRTILQRPKTTLIQRQKAEASQDQDIPDCSLADEAPPDKSPSDKSPSEMRSLDLAAVASEESDLSSIAVEDSISHIVTVMEALEDLDQVTSETEATNPLMEEMTDMKRLEEEDSQ